MAIVIRDDRGVCERVIRATLNYIGAGLGVPLPQGCRIVYEYLMRVDPLCRCSQVLTWNGNENDIVLFLRWLQRVTMPPSNDDRLERMTEDRERVVERMLREHQYSQEQIERAWLSSRLREGGYTEAQILYCLKIR